MAEMSAPSAQAHLMSVRGSSKCTAPTFRRAGISACTTHTHTHTHIHTQGKSPHTVKANVLLLLLLLLPLAVCALVPCPTSKAVAGAAA
jgi:hypothetical protein